MAIGRQKAAVKGDRPLLKVVADEVKGGGKNFPLEWDISLRADRRRTGPVPSKWLRGVDGLVFPFSGSNLSGVVVHNRVDHVLSTDHLNDDMVSFRDEESPLLVNEGNKRQRSRTIPIPNVSAHKDSLEVGK
ncbi:hypothetical protein ACFE04_015675 [Oxalis oulophora]